MLEGLGADATLLTRARGANTAMEVWQLAKAQNLPLSDRVAKQAREAALAVIAGGIELDVMVFDRTGNLIGHAR